MATPDDVEAELIRQMKIYFSRLPNIRCFTQNNIFKLNIKKQRVQRYFKILLMTNIGMVSFILRKVVSINWVAM